MKVLGTAHRTAKDTWIIATSLFSVLCVLALLVCILAEDTSIKVSAGCFLGFFVLCLILVVLCFALDRAAQEKTIIYDEDNQVFIIYKYKQVIKIKPQEITEVEFKKQGLVYIPFIDVFFVKEKEYGKITFFLKNEEIVVTSPVKKALDVTKEIKEIIRNSL